MMRGRTVGTHNLNVHDGKADAHPFADVLLFTETTKAEVAHDLPEDYVVDVCKRNRSLTVAWQEDVFRRTGHVYKAAHPGLAKVTPARGTYAVLGIDEAGRKTALIVEWRINAARPPYKRGEPLLRKILHAIHSGVTKRLVLRLRRQGHAIYVAGDANLPKHERAYPYLPSEVGQVGRGLDRIGSTRRLGQVTMTRAAEGAHPTLAARIMR